MGIDLFQLVQPGFEAAPLNPAIITPHGQSVTYKKLHLTIQSFCERLEEAGVIPGNRVTTDIRNPSVVIALVLALSRLGAVYIAGSTPRGIQKAGITVDVVVSDTIRPRGNVKEVLLTQAWSATNGRMSKSMTGFSDENAIAAILASSGTTGTPKFMAFPVSLIRQRLDDHDTVHGQGRSKCLITFGLNSPFGLELSLRVLRLGGMIAWPVESALQTLQQVAAHGVTEIYAAPGTLAELAHQQRRSKFDLSSLTRIVTAGSGIASWQVELARQNLAPVILNEYGSSELGPVSCIEIGTASETPGTVGAPAPWIDVRVDASSGKLLLKGEGNRLPENYLNTCTDKTMASQDGWFVPGDTGYLDEMGRLVITGRDNDLINTGGNKISARVLEETISTLPGIDACAVLPIPNEYGYDDIGLALVCTTGHDKDHLRRQLSASYENTAKIRILYLNELPKLAGGKTDLQTLKKLVSKTRRLELE
jgi:fatty-acyl-CoA synthase